METLLKANIAQYVGACDRTGHPLITLPATGHEALVSLRSADVLRLFQRFLDAAPVQQKLNGFSFLTDLGKSSSDVAMKLVNILSSLQSENERAVSCLFAIKAKSWKNRKSFAKLTGYKASKKGQAPKTPYQVVALKDLKSLLQHVDRASLPEEFGGPVQINRELWPRFYLLVDNASATAEASLSAGENAKRRAQAACEVTVPRSSDDIAHVLSNVNNTCKGIFDELRLDAAIEQCDGAIAELQPPAGGAAAAAKSSAAAASLARQFHGDLLREAARRVRLQQQALMELRERLQLMWRQAQARLIQAGQLLDHRRQASKICKWISRVGQPQLETLSYTPGSVEELRERASFLDETFKEYIKAEVLLPAERILTDVEYMAMQDSAELRESHAFMDRLRIDVEHLQDSLQIAEAMVESGECLLQQVAMVKLWYTDTVTSLPSGPSRQASSTDVARWHNACQLAVNKHKSSIPSRAILDRVSTDVERLPSQAKEKVKTTMHRVDILIKLLHGEENMNSFNPELVAQWRNELGLALMPSHEDDVPLVSASASTSYEVKDESFTQGPLPMSSVSDRGSVYAETHQDFNNESENSKAASGDGGETSGPLDLLLLVSNISHRDEVSSQSSFGLEASNLKSSNDLVLPQNSSSSAVLSSLVTQQGKQFSLELTVTAAQQAKQSAVPPALVALPQQELFPADVTSLSNSKGQLLPHISTAAVHQPVSSAAIAPSIMAASNGDTSHKLARAEERQPAAAANQDTSSFPFSSKSKAMDANKKGTKGGEVAATFERVISVPLLSHEALNQDGQSYGDRSSHGNGSSQSSHSSAVKLRSAKRHSHKTKQIRKEAVPSPASNHGQKLMHSVGAPKLDSGFQRGLAKGEGHGQYVVHSVRASKLRNGFQNGSAKYEVLGAAEFSPTIIQPVAYADSGDTTSGHARGVCMNQTGDTVSSSSASVTLPVSKWQLLYVDALNNIEHDPFLTAEQKLDKMASLIENMDFGDSILHGDRGDTNGDILDTSLDCTDMYALPAGSMLLDVPQLKRTSAPGIGITSESEDISAGYEDETANKRKMAADIDLLGITGCSEPIYNWLKLQTLQQLPSPLPSFGDSAGALDDNMAVLECIEKAERILKEVDSAATVSA